MHRWSQLFIPTLREAPGDAEAISHKLLLRAGYVRQLGSGLYSSLFLGNRSLQKIARLVRGEMDRFAQELCLPALQPREIWESSGRWYSAGLGMFRLRDLADRDLCLGLSHEEVVTQIAARELRSYKQLPQVWYHVHTAFRDERRPKAGLLYPREFISADSYSFDLDAVALDRTYGEHRDAFGRILELCGVRALALDAGVGEPEAQSLVVYTDAGEETVVMCTSCGYAATLKSATSKLAAVEDSEPAAGAPIEVSTPQQKTIDEVAAFLQVKPSQVIKSYLAVATHKTSDTVAQTPVIVFLRGDHHVDEAKLLAALARAGHKGVVLRPMEADEIRECFGLEPGFIGPVGLSPESFPASGGEKWLRPGFYVDLGLKGRRNLVAGANKAGFHLRNVTPDASSSFKVEADWWVDVRGVIEGEGCPRCDRALAFRQAVEVGRLRKLGSEFSAPMSVRVVDEHGREVTPLMGAFGMALDRILAARIEQNHDENGFWLPPSVAPFEVVVTPANTTDANIKAGAEEIAQALADSGIDVLLDDRDERPGVKFKDADLVGIPYRINVGKKLVEGQVELFTRQTSSKVDILKDSVVQHLHAILTQPKPASINDAGNGFSS